MVRGPPVPSLKIFCLYLITSFRQEDQVDQGFQVVGQGDFEAGFRFRFQVIDIDGVFLGEDDYLDAGALGGQDLFADAADREEAAGEGEFAA